MPINLDDQELIIALASSSASLADSPGDQDNWVERAGSGGRGGELPKYVRKLARGIMKSGKTKSQAIAIAISRIKVWAAGGSDVNADTRAKAVKALAEWESLKAKSKSNKLVKLSGPSGEYFALSNTPFNVNVVEQAWNAIRTQAIDEYYESKRNSSDSSSSDTAYDPVPDNFPYIQEIWTTFIIVRVPRIAQPPMLVRVPYVVKGTKVHFGLASEVKATFEPVTEDFTEDERVHLAGILPPPVLGG